MIFGRASWTGSGIPLFMRTLTQSGDLIITCGRGVAPMLAAELKHHGYIPRPVEDTAWAVTGSLGDAQKLNLWLRSAQRVLMPLYSFRARNADDLYKALAAQPWENYLRPDGYFSITTGVDMPGIRDPRFAALRAKDAIADRMTKARGQRPDSGGDRNQTVFHLHWRDDEATLCLDTSGEPLSRRGYRIQTGAAPMQESLAAACILASPWRGESAFVNPMCGSGTLAIEAALIARNRAPGLLRRNFGFMHVKGYREEDWKKIKREAEAAEHPRSGPAIIATDISPRALAAAQANAERAHVVEDITFSVCDFADTAVPPPPGVIYFNPEYGERLGDPEKLEPTYRRIGDFLKQKCTGYMAYVFTANLPLSKRIGLHNKRRMILYNANLEGRLLEFELYSGTRDPGPLGADLQ